jgi:hypothetical protein
MALFIDAGTESRMFEKLKVKLKAKKIKDYKK